MEHTNQILEARRYVANAKTILKEKAVKDGDYYTDSKYIKMAGHTPRADVSILRIIRLQRRNGAKNCLPWSTVATTQCTSIWDTTAKRITA